MEDAELEALKIQKMGGREVPQSVPTLKESVPPPPPRGLLSEGNTVNVDIFAHQAITYSLTVTSYFCASKF